MLVGHIVAGGECIHTEGWADPWHQLNVTKAGHDVEKTDKHVHAKLEVAVRSALVMVVVPEGRKTSADLAMHRNVALVVDAARIGSVETSEVCCGCCRYAEVHTMPPYQTIDLFRPMAMMARRMENAMLAPIQAAELHL